MSEQPATESPGSAPWYQYPWVWFVFCVPLSAVVFGVVMIVSANYQPDDLVVDDYYKEGMGINRRLEMDEQARLTGATFRLSAVTDEGAVFEVRGAAEALQLQLFHVTDRSRDLAITLKSLGNEVYVADSEELSQRLREAGIWYLEVRDDSNKWRLRQRLVTPVNALELGQ